jgi:hypothetical protein
MGIMIPGTIFVDSIVYCTELEDDRLEVFDQCGNLLAAAQKFDASSQCMFEYWDDGEELCEDGGVSSDLFYNPDWSAIAQWLISTHPIQ